jgi:hypothetical protein
MRNIIITVAIIIILVAVFIVSRYFYIRNQRSGPLSKKTAVEFAEEVKFHILE